MKVERCSFERGRAMTRTLLWCGFALVVTFVGFRLAVQPTGLSPAEPVQKAVAAPVVRTDTASATAWANLSLAQRQALAPLEDVWPTLDTAQQQKWQRMTGQFEAKSPQAQRRIHARMQAWALLTPAQRAQARLSFRQAASRYGPGQRNAQWQAYKELPPEKRPHAERRLPRPVAPVYVQAARGATTMLFTQKFALSAPEDAARLQVPGEGLLQSVAPSVQAVPSVAP